MTIEKQTMVSRQRQPQVGCAFQMHVEKCANAIIFFYTINTKSKHKTPKVKKHKFAFRRTSFLARVDAKFSGIHKQTRVLHIPLTLLASSYHSARSSQRKCKRRKQCKKHLWIFDAHKFIHPKLSGTAASNSFVSVCWMVLY